MVMLALFKDGASFCYCAYVLCILGYSGFLTNLPTKTTIFLRGLTMWKKQILARASKSKKKIWCDQSFFRDN